MLCDLTAIYFDIAALHDDGDDDDALLAAVVLISDVDDVWDEL